MDEKEIESRLTRLEVLISEIRENLKSLDEKLEPDYFNDRVEEKAMELFGRLFWRIFFAVLSSGAIMSLVLSYFTK